MPSRLTPPAPRIPPRGWLRSLLNSTGTDNTADGVTALYSNTTGQLNSAIGTQALYRNTSGSFNTGNGAQALQANTTGTSNTATGYTALFSNTIGASNTAVGLTALGFNTTGGNNTATGTNALVGNTTGSNNIAVGNLAGSALTTGNNNIDIGNAGIASEAGRIRIGTTGTQTATFIAGIRGVPVTGAQPVGVNASGQLGVRASSARFKAAIRSMDKTSEAILALQPVTFRYKRELDPSGQPQFGLVAEQVAKISSDLVTVDDQGKPFTVRYEAVNAMLLNEFLKEHRKNERQQEMIIAQQKQIEALTAMVKKQSEKIQKVSDQVALSKPAPQLVLNDK
jgi:trimeric autotransporter adhesin